MNVTILAIDLAKRVFQLHGVNAEGKAVLKKRLSRLELVEFIAKLSPCLIGMEACGTAHYWGRKFQALGHEVKLINLAFVKPYLKSNKNDYHDAEAICEALILQPGALYQLNLLNNRMCNASIASEND